MDLRKLTSEIDIKNTIEAFEILRQDTDLFYGWNKFDIQKLCENMKVLSFSRNSTILHKNEQIEYFGIVLGGKLLIKQGDNVIGHLGAGDIVGYMSYMEFAGTKMSPFDVTAEIEGFLATFRYDEFKQLYKKDPNLGYKITEMLGKKTLNTISLQYKGEELYKPTKLKPTGPIINTKRVKEAMDTCPELTEFFERMDQRDKKNLTKTFEYVEFEREQKIAYQGAAADYLLILVKGELISFKEDKPAVFYKPGSIVGVREFLYGLSWEENILGKAKGTILKLGRQSFEELKQTSAASASGFIRSLVWHQCRDIKNRYQDRSPLEKTKEQDKNLVNPLNEFVEYEITKHLDFINGQRAKLMTTRPLIKDFMTKKEMLPLYMHSIHQSLLPNPKQVNLIETNKKIEQNIPGCAFLREKMEKQVEEARINKIKNRGKLMLTKKAASDGKALADKGPADEDYEDLKNNYILLESENQELRDQLHKSHEETKNLNKLFKELQDLQMTSSTRINKTLMHKELISKDFINNDTASFLTRNYNSQFASFGDVLNDQHFVSSKAKRVAKFAYKWLATTKARKKIMII